jgi:hypothetical protein
MRRQESEGVFIVQVVCATCGSEDGGLECGR